MTTKSPSLVRNVLLSQAALVILFFAMAVGALYNEYKSVGDNLREGTLRTQADEIFRHLKTDQNNLLTLDLPYGLSQAYREANGIYLFTVSDPNGTLLFSSNKRDFPLYPFDPNHKKSQYFQFEDIQKELTYFGASYQFDIGTRSIWLQVAQDESHYDILADTLADEFFENIGWILPFFFIGLLVSSTLILRLSMRSLNNVSKKAQEIGPSNTEIRLPEKNVPSEVLPLVQAVNNALERLERGFELQRRFTADAAHELRTPLAVLNARIESVEDQKLAKLLQKDTKVMTRLVAQLLKAAQLDSLTISADDQVDLMEASKDVISLLTPLAVKQGKMLEIDENATPEPISGNYDAIYHMIRNLLENALTYTPKGSTVTLSLDKGPSLSIRDHGPGIASGDKENLFKRFWRADRSDTQKGSGLGLSIVAKTVKLHGASIDVDNHPEGGAIFTVKFAKNIK
ncbi:putative Histidine kinase [Candidatus Terasakiella magnetica]|uniref:histidine kinase n=1 Tax=Candidatus Terasakiella magnetica TaxID=1867952 RepID=A0A1C3RHW5_9PROT|nr:ATP-binding protein [Candidatus Terasakiella magnetica]SCA56866.1 putative Histidine kinase [Candidatus Terasakiella magnetica]